MISNNVKSSNISPLHSILSKLSLLHILTAVFADVCNVQFKQVERLMPASPPAFQPDSNTLHLACETKIEMNKFDVRSYTLNTAK